MTPLNKALLDAQVKKDARQNSHNDYHFGVREVGKKHLYWCPIHKQKMVGCQTSCEHYKEIDGMKFCTVYFRLTKKSFATMVNLHASNPAEMMVKRMLEMYRFRGTRWDPYRAYKAWQPKHTEELNNWRKDDFCKTPLKVLIEKAESNALRKSVRIERVRCVTVRLKSIPKGWSEEELKKIGYLIHRVVNRFTLTFTIERKNIQRFKSAVGVSLEIKGDFFTE